MGVLWDVMVEYDKWVCPVTKIAAIKPVLSVVDSLHRGPAMLIGVLWDVMVVYDKWVCPVTMIAAIKPVLSAALLTCIWQVLT